MEAHSVAMNWLYVVENPLTSNSASRSHVLEFCQAISKVDHITLVSQADPSSLAEYVDFECLQIKPIHIRPHNLGFLLDTIKAYCFLNQIIKVKKPDIIYVRAIAMSIGPFLIAKRRNIPVIMEINGNWEDEHQLALKHLFFPKKQIVALTNMFRSYSLILSCRLASLLIAVTPSIAKFIQQKWIKDNGKIHIASNGVNIKRFKPLDIMECKKQLGLDPNIDFIGFIGSLSAWQGVDDLITAYSRLPKDFSQCFRLLIVGDGPELQRCKEISRKLHLGESVIFTGSQPYSLIPQYQGACSILVAPKKPLLSGYSPLKIYEYLASARPIIASNVLGLEFLAQIGAGLLFSSGDVNDLELKLEAMINFPEHKRVTMGELGREYVVLNHSWDLVVFSIRQFIMSKIYENMFDSKS